ncbi:MAG TPA: arginine deiminase-related protein [Candidatus Eisenbacteria bacterium]|nr:arginine deiminase-related protein [Candidatus Eisenbacteria bacterium]
MTRGPRRSTAPISMFHTAIVRPPGSHFARGLTRGYLGTPDLDRARAQHRDYVRALERCGLEVVVLEPVDIYPDSTFIEDTAVLLPQCAVLARPGAPSRRGEVELVREALASRVARVRTIEPPGTLDGGDVCEIGSHFLIGISERTNDEGAAQLEEHLAEEGFTSGRIALNGDPELLHLKSGLSWLGGRRLMATETLAAHPALAGFEIVRVESDEQMGANGVRLNDHMLIPAGFPRLEARLGGLGLPLIALEMSEFQKMEGGISCLSLRLGDARSQRGM